MEGFNVKDKSLLENKEFLQELMERMMLVHTFEERAFWLFGQGLVHGTMHLSIGAVSYTHLDVYKRQGKCQIG